MHYIIFLPYSMGETIVFLSSVKLINMEPFEFILSVQNKKLKVEKSLQITKNNSLYLPVDLRTNSDFGMPNFGTN